MKKTDFAAGSNPFARLHISDPRFHVRRSGGRHSPSLPAAGGQESSQDHRDQRPHADRQLLLAAREENPDVKAYLDAENVYTDAVMKPTEGLQKSSMNEMLSRIKETDVEVPYKERLFLLLRTEAGKQYGIRCRKKGSMDAPEEVVLDVNELAKGQKFMSLGAYNVSDDGNLPGVHDGQHRIPPVHAGCKGFAHRQIAGRPRRARRFPRWANDNKTIFYTLKTRCPSGPIGCIATTSARRPDALIYEEKDERFDIAPARRAAKPTYCSSPAATPPARRVTFPPISPCRMESHGPRKQDVEYYPDHNGDFFYIRVNDTGRNFRLVKAPVSDPSSKNWREVVPHRTDVSSMIRTSSRTITSPTNTRRIAAIRVTNLKAETRGASNFRSRLTTTIPYVNRDRYDKFR